MWIGCFYYPVSFSLLDGNISRYLQAHLKLDQVISALSKDGVPAVWLIEVLLNILAFLLVFLAVALLLKVITRKLKVLNKIPIIGPLNIFLGAVLGIIKGFLVVFLIVALISLIETPFWSSTVEASVIVALSQHYMAFLFNLIFINVVDNLGQLI